MVIIQKVLENMYMSTIINKSNHPVEVKRINIQVWKLRDEIEKAIALRLEECGGDSDKLDIEDIREFYSRTKPAYLDPDYDPEDDEEDDNVIPIDTDEDSEAMLEALEEKEDSDDDSEDSDEEDEGSTEDEETSDKNEDASKEENTEDNTTKNEEKVDTVELKRVHPDSDKMSKGFSLLSDMNMENIVFFSQDGYTHGQNITIEFLIPKKFMISAEVFSCTNMARKSKIISESKPNYRVEAEITYFWDGERTNLRDFLKSVEPVIPPPPKKMKRPDSDEDEDDEFEDLGF